MDDLSTSLNKFISQTGFCSRREADTLIETGKVKINGQVAQKGNRVLPKDHVTINGKPLRAVPQQVYIALNKPAGITCTTDLSIKGNIITFLKHPKRIFPIGRLDKPSTGLILLTNDGDIVNEILRAEHNHEKEYIVSVDRPITDDFIHKMGNGLPVLDIITNKCLVEKKGKNLFKIVLTQGLNRQIRRMCDYLGYEVVTLKRVRIMNIHLGDLKEGHWRDLTAEEMRVLRASFKKSEKTTKDTKEH
jgi:23S rRNA pseudouridine2604 synthase